jgi:hypothetical protein
MAQQVVPYVTFNTQTQSLTLFVDLYITKFQDHVLIDTVVAPTTQVRTAVMLVSFIVDEVR